MENRNNNESIEQSNDYVGMYIKVETKVNVVAIVCFKTLSTSKFCERLPQQISIYTDTNLHAVYRFKKISLQHS